MSIKNIGVDIEDSLRFKQKDYSENKHFYEKIFSEKEIKYCLGKSKPYIHFSGKFSAKEALIKAMSNKLDFKDIEVLNDETGKPSIYIKNVLKTNILLSISHTNSDAIAFVVIKETENE